MERRTAFRFGPVCALSTGSTKYGYASYVGPPPLTVSPPCKSLGEL